GRGGEVSRDCRFVGFLPCACCLVSCLLQRQLALEPIQLRLVVPLPRVLYLNQRLSQHSQPLRCLPHFSVGLDQQRQQLTTRQLGSCRLEGSQSLPHLFNAFYRLSVHGQRPPPKDCGPR